MKLTDPATAISLCVIAGALTLAAESGSQRRAEMAASAPSPPAASAAAAAAPPRDEPLVSPHGDRIDALPEGKGREVTFVVCGACHKFQLVVSQGMSRERWDETVDLMVEKHRMGVVDPPERTLIVDYLAEHYPPRRRGRGADNPFLRQ